MKKRLIVGITGDRRGLWGRDVENPSNHPGWESHVVLSDAGALNLWHELAEAEGARKARRRRLPPEGHRGDDRERLYLTEGMVIAPAR